MARNIADNDEEDFNRGAPPIGDEIAPPKPILATPFEWRDEADIPPRKWLYGRHLLRKFVSVDVAAGGVGKSSVKIGEALAMTTNQTIYGKEIGEGPLRVWLYNLEDPAEETERRIHATAKRFHITPFEIGGRLFADSGRDQALVIADESDVGTRIIRPVVDSIIAEIQRRLIDVLIIDPFVSSHEVSENDNPAIDKVTKEWGRIADICDCSINLVHHVRKGNGAETNADSSRGAKSLIDAARSVNVYNRMTEDEAQNANIPPEERAFYFRVSNDKANLAPPEKADWFRMNNVDLLNGDSVGVACPWEWPDLFAGISLSKTKEVQKQVGAGKLLRFDSQARNWVGNIIGDVLSMDSTDTAEKKRINKILRQWVKEDVLRIYSEQDDKGNDRKFVEVGKWIAE